MLPPSMQPHTLSVVTPALVQGDYGADEYDYDSPTPRSVRGFVQPVSRREVPSGADRQALPYEYVVWTNDTSVTHRDRITWNSHTFEVIGIQVHYTMRGESHATIDLHRVDG